MCHSHHGHHHGYDEERRSDSVDRWSTMTAGERADRRQQAFRARAIRYGWLVMICLALSVLTGIGGWIMWVVAFLGIRLGMQARRAYGSEIDADELPPARVSTDQSPDYADTYV